MKFGIKAWLVPDSETEIEIKEFQIQKRNSEFGC